MKQLVDITYKCPVRACPNKLWTSNEWTEKDPKKIEKLVCKDHLDRYEEFHGSGEKAEYKAKKPMTPWEKEKAEYMKTDSQWQDHISHRKIIVENGKKVPVIVDDSGTIKRRIPDPKER